MMNIDANSVIDEMSMKLAEIMKENAILKVQIKTMQDQKIESYHQNTNQE